MIIHPSVPGRHVKQQPSKVATVSVAFPEQFLRRRVLLGALLLTVLYLCFL